MTDLLAGRISLADSPSVLGEHILSGAVPGLAVFSDERTPTLPGVQTMPEAGFPAVQSLEPWQSVMLPRGTPPEVVARLNTAINQFLARPETCERFPGMGMVPMGGPSDQADRFVRDEAARWVPILRSMNLS